jgi:hypothetical protein
MFVPSLSWQNDRFEHKNGSKEMRFSHQLFTDPEVTMLCCEDVQGPKMLRENGLCF